MNNHINNIINTETFNSVSYLINNTFINLMNRRFNEIKYFHIIWNLLHLISVEYPDFPSDELKQETIQFIKNFKLLSCNSCRKYDIPDENDIISAVETKEYFIQFLINYHSNINKSIHKCHLKTYTIDTIIQKYMTNDYKTFFKSTYDIDIDYMISNYKLNILYDKLSDIKSHIYKQINIDVKMILND